MPAHDLASVEAPEPFGYMVPRWGL